MRRVQASKTSVLLKRWIPIGAIATRITYDRSRLETRRALTSGRKSVAEKPLARRHLCISSSRTDPVPSTPEAQRMTKEVDADLVAAARDGDRAALDTLSADCLPLVSTVVGQALSHRFDIEDTVQETMLNVVRGLPKLRDPTAFPAWLITITMNEIRKHRRRRAPAPQPPEAFDGLADPGSDFTDLVIDDIGLARQRRQTAEATLWLDDSDRELLSLWWLTETGGLSRAAMATALGISTHTVTMRVTRMKTQLDTARRIIRALATAPPCHVLATVTATWPGRPSRLWRKRISRHLRECDYCLSSAEDLVPIERLLTGPPPPTARSEPALTSHPYRTARSGALLAS